MGFFQRIIDWFLSLFGGGKKEPAQLSAGDKAQIQKSAIQGLDEVEGAENIKVHGTGDDAKVIKQVDGAQLIEEDGETQWVDRVNKEIPRERWVDDWGPLASIADREARLVEFVYHEKNFDMTRDGDPLAAEQKIVGYGYRDVGHFFRVRGTVLKHYGVPQGPNVDDAIFSSQEFMNAAMKAGARMHGDTMQATAAANPELLAPVEGVSVELYAQIAARVAQSIPQDELLALLAQHGLDYATWDRASKVWNDRMSKDTTATIATIYGKAFMNSGQGQFGAAGQAYAATGFDGSAASGAEPVPFERFCEISGAMSGWAKSGQDVNALLKLKFGMVAADYSSVSTWWLSQLTADMSRFDEYNRKMEHYEKQYMGAAAAPQDNDLQF